MKALPLWQPWAQLVALGVKRIETRSWPAPGSLIGERIAIHATKGGLPRTSEIGLLRVREFAQAFGVDTNLLSAEALADRLPRGAIVATTVVERCERMTPAMIKRLTLDDPRERTFGDYAEGRFAWHLGDVVAIEEPVPARGRQGIFDVPDQLVGGKPRQGALL